MKSCPPERWQRVKDLFNASLDLDPARRGIFLDTAIQDDPELRLQVESLLQHHDQAGNFINFSVVELAAHSWMSRGGDLVAGQMMGPYRILQPLGHGGMGAVYLAERADQQYQKRVAIKCIQNGLDSASILERFRRERQILADLDHPNIARLLDGGTSAEGLSYIVMEYVDGLPIDTYCEVHALGIRERLKIFRAVCGAVHYAHQNLVIHRDLKPGNILVTDDGTPKLLDFGIAKLLGAELGEDTVTGTALMTPEFASPEQVRREAITTVSDVYSLGVLLYLLMAGHRPYRFTTGGPDEILKLVCGQDPERPSTAPSPASASAGPAPPRKALLGDIDNIVMMAMRKEPQRRYGSVEQFSEDIQRYLTGLPVLARQDTFGYQASKFIRRNRTVVAAACLAVVALIVGTTVALRQAQVARAERAKAERRFNDVRQLANSLLFQFHDAIKDMPGTLEARKRLVDQAREYLDRLANEPGDDASLRNELAMSYTRLAWVSEDSKAVVENLRKALAINQVLASAEPSHPAYRCDLAKNHGDLSGQLRMIGDTTGALEHSRESLRIMSGLMGVGTQNAEWRYILASLHQTLGMALAEAGDLPGSMASLGESLALASELARQAPANLEYRQILIVSLFYLGDILQTTGDHAGALDHHRRALAIIEVSRGDAPGHSTFFRDACIVHRRIGSVLTDMGEPAGALKHHETSLRMIRFLMAADPTDMGHERVLAHVHRDMGDAFSAAGNPRQALASYRQALSVSRAVAKRDMSRTESRADSAMALARIGRLLAGSGPDTKAFAPLLEASVIYESLHRDNPMNAPVQWGIADAQARLGELYAEEAVRTLPAKRREAWHKANLCFHRSLGLLRGLQRGQTLLKTEQATFIKAANGVARCREALSDTEPSL